MKKRFSFLIILLFPSFFAEAQVFSTSVSKNQFVIGEQIVFTIRLMNFDTALMKLNFWPDSILRNSNLTIVKKEKPDSFSFQKNKIEISQQITVTAFQPGNILIPSIATDIYNYSNKTTKTFFSNPISLNVLAVDVNAMNDFNDIKDIIETKQPIRSKSYLPYIIAVIATIVVFISIFIVRKRKRKRAVGVGYFLKKIRKLQYSKDSLSEKCLKLDVLFKKYLQTISTESGLHSTKNEVLFYIQKELSNQADSKKHFHVFEMMDHIKFARYEPTDQEMHDAFTAISFLIKKLNKHVG